MGRKILLFLLSFCISTASFPLRGENLLKNAGFQMNHGNGEISGWKINKELAEQKTENVSEDGKSCLKIRTETTTKSPGILSQRIKVIPGKRYSLTVTAKRDSFVNGTSFRVRFFINGKEKEGIQEKSFRSSSWEPTTLVFPSRNADEIEIQIVNPNTGNWRITKNRSLFLEKISLSEIDHKDDLKFNDLKDGKNILKTAIASSGEYYLWLKATPSESSKYTLKTKSGEWSFQSYTYGKSRWIRPVLPMLILEKGEEEIEFAIDGQNTGAEELILTMDPFFEPVGTKNFLAPAPGCPASIPDLSKELKSGKVELSVDSRLPKGKWGITQGIPFPCGEFRNAKNTRMEDGRKLQCQTLAHWPDGSIKWLQVSTTASSLEKMNLLYGSEVKSEGQNSSFKIDQAEDGISVENGKLKFKIPFEGDAFIKDINSGKDQIDSALLFLNSDTALEKREIKIEEPGPVRSVFRISGQYPKNPELSYLVRIFVYENSEYLELEHTVSFGGEKSFTIENCGMIFKAHNEEVYAKPGTEWIALGKAKDGISFEAEVKSQKSGSNDFPFEIKASGKTIFSGKKANGMLKVTGNPNAGLTVRNFWQNVPESLRIDAENIYVSLISKDLVFWHGMGKTQNILLDFSKEQNASEVFTRKALLTASPEWYCNSKAFHAWPLSTKNTNWNLYEDSVKNTIGCWEERFDKNMASPASFKNMMYFGETGKDAGNNMETALGEGVMVQYLRSLQRQHFDFAEMMILHFADVDIDHSKNKSRGHVYKHCTYEREDTKDMPNGHSWFNGTLLYGFFTASKRIMEIGEDVGKYHSQMLPRWDIYEYVHYWRQPAWQLMCIIQGWDVSGNWEFLERARNIVEMTKAQRDHIISLWPYMFSVGMKGLREYYETTGDPEVRELYLQIFDGYMRLRMRKEDRSFGEHEKGPGMLLGNYPNDRSCCFYNEAAQSDWLAGQKRYAFPAGKDMTIQLEYGINDPTFLWGSADLLRAMKENGMPFISKAQESPATAMLPLVQDSPLAALKCPVIMFQIDKKEDSNLDVFLTNRPHGKYSGLFSGIAVITDNSGKTVDSCRIRTDGLRNFKLHIPKSGKTSERYTGFIILQDYWRWTIEDISFDLKKGLHKLELSPRYSRLLIDEICLSKKSGFDPFSGKARVPEDCIFIHPEDSIISEGFVKEEHLSAKGGAAIRKGEAETPLVLTINIPEDGRYYFSARIWKGMADLMEVSLDGTRPVVSGQIHDMESNDYTFWSIGINPAKNVSIKITGEEKKIQGKNVIFFEGKGLKNVPPLNEVLELLRKDKEP